MRLSGRFLFIHTQKHTQEYLLDFRSSTTHHDCWLLEVHGPVTLSRTYLVPATPHRTPTPQNSFGSHPATFTSCSARTTTTILKTPPPSFLKVPVIFYFYCIPLEIFGSDAAATIHPKVGGISLGNQVGGA
jgi:hypothetical protein